MYDAYCPNHTWIISLFFLPIVLWCQLKAISWIMFLLLSFIPCLLVCTFLWLIQDKEDVRKKLSKTQQELKTSDKKNILITGTNLIATVSWDDFKQNWKNLQQYLHSTANTAWIGPIWHCCLAGRFHALTARILRKTDLKSLNKTLQSYVDLVERFFYSI